MNMTRLIPLLSALLLIGCASPIQVMVDAISDPELASGERYVFTSAMEEIDENDLYFREFSRHFQMALEQQGYAKTTDENTADMAIAFSYGISDGKTVPYLFTTPRYEWIEGDTVSLLETKTDTSGTTTTTTEIHIPPRYRIVGTEIHAGSYTYYIANVTLEAKQLHGDGLPLWRTTIEAVSDNRDLRHLIPVMAAAAAPYLGKNTGKAITLELRDSDPRVKQILLDTEPQ